MGGEQSKQRCRRTEGLPHLSSIDGSTCNFTFQAAWNLTSCLGSSRRIGVKKEGDDSPVPFFLTTEVSQVPRSSATIITINRLNFKNYLIRFSKKK